VIDQFYMGLVQITEYFNSTFVKTQSGILRWYVMGIVVGAILIMTISLFVQP
jgi:NADH-quinone oxidoreductase subunit L